MIIEHNGTTYKQFETVDLRQIMDEINSIMQGIHEQGRVVKSVMIDGIDATGSLESFLISNQEAIHNIAIESVTPDEMIASLYSDTVEYLKKVSHATETISDLFYGEVDMDAWRQLSQMSEALGFTVETLQMIASHRQGQDDHVTFTGEVARYIEEVQSHVNEINQAIEDQDMVLIGDIIRYELGQTVSRMLDAMVSRVEQ